MAEYRRREEDLQARVRALEIENARLRAGLFSTTGGNTVRVPPQFRDLFRSAEKTVDAYFREFVADPSQGTIEIAGERYLLVRASALSYGFLYAIRSLYADRGDAEAMHIGKTLLFDIAHVLGINDARNFHQKMGLTDPVAKMSAGPRALRLLGLGVRRPPAREPSHAGTTTSSQVPPPLLLRVRLLAPRG